MLGHILRRKNALDAYFPSHPDHVTLSTDDWDVIRQLACVLDPPEPTRRSISAVVKMGWCPIRSTK